jgi:hypothetical protein
MRFHGSLYLAEVSLQLSENQLQLVYFPSQCGRGALPGRANTAALGERKGGKVRMQHWEVLW